ncbi:hypothetical protein JCM10908_002967 [Rhodotorula pacifica]|uniref:uncharacterized protein n=1 Tax=Rhodotorula pacifica TaxID=1495444 RepID=UPI00317D667D
MADSNDGDAAPGGGTAAAAGGGEGVYRIVKPIKIEGLETSYLVQLEQDGKNVKRTETEMRQLAPDLLAAYEIQHAGGQLAAAPSSDILQVPTTRKARNSSSARNYRDASGSEDEQDDNDGDSGRARPQRASTKRGKGKKSSRDSSPEPDDSGDETVSSQGSESASGGEEEYGGSDGADAYSSSRPSRGSRKGKQPEAQAQGTRRSNRDAAQAKKNYAFDRSDDEDDHATSEPEIEQRTTTTRSGRVSKRASASVASSEQAYRDVGNSDDELSIQTGSRGSSVAATRAAQRAAAAAAEEAEEEDELGHDSMYAEAEHPTRPQDLHRGSCAKCEQEPTDVLLTRLAARRAKKKPGRKRRRDELEEDTDAEQDRLEKLGSWVQCGVCCVAYHFGCLPATQKRELTDKLKAEHLAKNPPENDLLTSVLDGASTGASNSARSSKATTPTLKGMAARPKLELKPEKTFTISKCPFCKKVGGRRCFVCGLSGKRITQGELDMIAADIAREAAEAEPEPTQPVEVIPAQAAEAAPSQPVDADPSQPALGAPSQPAEAAPTAVTTELPQAAAAISTVAEATAPPQPPTVPSAEAGPELTMTVAVAEAAPVASTAPLESAVELVGEVPTEIVSEAVVEAPRAPGLMFRCSSCKRTAHFGCLEHDEPDWTFEDHCKSYHDWSICHDCYAFSIPLDVILAWAETDPLPPPSAEDIEPDDEIVEKVTHETRVDEKTKKVVVIPSAKDPQAAAKYLVKWQDVGYRHLDWVPHAFLAAKYPAKLANFLARGSTVTFDAPKDDDPEDAEPDAGRTEDVGEAPLPDPNAEERVPRAWKTVDRILSVAYKHPKKADETVEFYAFKKKMPEDPDESIKLVAQCYIKWGDLAYKEATLEAPPEPDEEGYSEYVAAYKAFLVANSPKMLVPRLSNAQMDLLDAPRVQGSFRPIKQQPEYLTGGTLMDFQMEGVNFLRSRWWQKKGCILADEMGLGKTCQVLSFLSTLNYTEGARPFLVVVPNSLVGNWLREFARWAPTMRVVPYNGDGESRKIVEDFEMFDPNGSLKTHVVLATYEALQGNGAVFRRVPRWDCLVVDEGQRLKGGKASQLYSVINTLRIGHRVILSGTPLNNNLRELFNLLAFINPNDYPDVESVTNRFADLTPELVEEVRVLLKPYFLRRTKDLVLNLPPLLEVVVPVTMTSLQRRVYRGVLERNASAIQAIARKAGAGSSGGAGGRSRPKKSNFSNILMELRKSLCHPYLVNDELEPRDVTPQQAHQNLTDASAKFVLLARMLPKLKAAGHRVLIFSQFKLTLNILERFLTGLELKYLRLDGDTPQIERQRDVDRYNAPGSEFFAYLLSTRAGGVGLNITSADVVIIYDQDFNPQMDIQAISRAHRIGQTKPVRVFKLLVKGTCEEKILNAGQKKRGLEHLIIQRIDATDESEDMESMLQFGATAVFDDDNAEKNAIRYTDQDVDDLLAKTAKPVEKKEDAASTFATAQIWIREGGELDTFDADKVEDKVEPENLHDFWSKVVDQQQEVERSQKVAQAMTIGRGKRRRAQVNYKIDPASPQKESRGSTPSLNGESSGDDYRDKDDLDSDYEGAQTPLYPDDLDLRDPNDPRLPPLARLVDGTRSGRSGSDAPGSRSRRRAHGESEEVLRRREASDRRAIDGLKRDAASINHADAQRLLYEAENAMSRTERIAILRQTSYLLLAKRSELERATFAASQAGTPRSDHRHSSARRPGHSSSALAGATPTSSRAHVSAESIAARSDGSHDGRSAHRDRSLPSRQTHPASSSSASNGAVSHELVKSASSSSRTDQREAVERAGQSLLSGNAGMTVGEALSTIGEGGSGTAGSGKTDGTAMAKKHSSDGYRQSALSFAKAPTVKGGTGSASPTVPMKRLAEETDDKAVARSGSSSSTSTAKASAPSRDRNGVSPRPEKKQKMDGPAKVVVISDSETE